MELESIENRIILVRNCKVILDRDIAKLYGVETKRVNQAVKNNPDKFPEGYILQLTSEEWNYIKSKDSTLNPSGRGRHSKFLPKAFSEKAIYMLATILKSPVATQTTIAIIETFDKLRQFSQIVKEASEQQDTKKQNKLLKTGNTLVKEIINKELKTVSTETTIELDFSILKVKHTVKREAKKSEDKDE